MMKVAVCRYLYFLVSELVYSIDSVRHLLRDLIRAPSYSKTHIVHCGCTVTKKKKGKREGGG